MNRKSEFLNLGQTSILRKITFAYPYLLGKRKSTACCYRASFLISTTNQRRDLARSLGTDTNKCLTLLWFHAVVAAVNRLTQLVNYPSTKS
jgi:hypothetical protein